MKFCIKCGKERLGAKFCTGCGFKFPIETELDTKMEVVPWNEYYPNINNAPQKVKQFYEYWKHKIQNGEYVELQESISYIFVYVYSLIRDFIENQNISHLEAEFQNIKNIYGHTKVKNYLDSWLYHSYLYIEDYNSAWNFIRDTWYQSPDEFLFFSYKLGRSVQLHGVDILNMAGTSSLTKYGKEELEEIEKLADLFLDDFYIEHEMNILDYFCSDIPELDKLDKRKNTNWIEKYEQFYRKKSKYKKYKEIDDYQISTGYKTDYISSYKKGLFRGVPIWKIQSNVSVGSIKLGHTIKNAFLEECRRILRECENTLREERDIPKIGEGWVSETNLYHNLKEHFSHEKVVHHGRPEWLGRQHLDIYFPEHSIAIEYQGKQHLEPVAYFGGEKAFKRQQQRDKRKNKRCLANGCDLLYVYPDYDLEEVVKKIKTLIKSKK